MQLASIAPPIVVEAQEQEKKIKDIRHDELTKTHSIDDRNREEEHQGENFRRERLGRVIDLVAHARHKKAEIDGKKRIRAIRAYESVANFESSFVFRGRFNREA